MRCMKVVLPDPEKLLVNVVMDYWCEQKVPAMPTHTMAVGCARDAELEDAMSVFVYYSVDVYNKAGSKDVVVGLKFENPDKI